jgi:endonuclease YncB( thermonuclease family)
VQEGSAPNEPKKVLGISAKCAHSIRSLPPLRRKAMCASPIEPGQVEVLDGDTIRVAGETFRPVGFDTPETYRAPCPSEHALV